MAAGCLSVEPPSRKPSQHRHSSVLGPLNFNACWILSWLRAYSSGPLPLKGMGVARLKQACAGYRRSSKQCRIVKGASPTHTVLVLVSDGCCYCLLLRMLSPLTSRPVVRSVQRTSAETCVGVWVCWPLRTSPPFFSTRSALGWDLRRRRQGSFSPTA